MTFKVEQHANGTIIRTLNGERHSLEDLPAYEGTDGFKAWYKNGKRHRESGPAIIYSNGTEEFWLNGVEHKELTMNQIEELLECKIKVIK